MEQDDPADWSIERVIQELCSSPSPNWIAGADLKPLIKPELIANAIKDNDIDGDTLLALEEQSLKSDLNIGSLGQRYRLMKVISHLRSLSLKYQAQHVRLASTAVVSPQILHTPGTWLGHSPSCSGLSIQTSIENNVSNEKRNFGNIHNGPIGKFQQRASIPGDNHTENFRRLQTSSEISTRPAIEAVPSLADNHDPSRSSMHKPVQLMTDATSTSGEQNHSFLNTLDSAINHELDEVTNSIRGKPKVQENHAPGAVITNKPQKAPKRAKLMPVTDRIMVNGQFGIPTLSEFPERPSNKRSEFTSDSVPRPRISLPSEANITQSVRRRARRADQIPRRNPESLASNSGATESDEPQAFLIWGSAKPKGQTKRVARQTVPITGRSHQPPARVILLPEVTSLEKSRDLPSFDLDSEDLAFLQRYPADPDGFEYPLWGESDEEDRYTSRSEDTPPPVKAGAKDMLSGSEIDTIIDEAFEQYRNDWQSSSLVKTQIKAHRKWMIAAKNRVQYRGILETCIRWQDKARRRIESLRAGIHLSDWRKIEDVKHQCLAIEASIHLLEEFSHYVEVLRREKEPYLPPLPTVKKGPSHRSHKIMENGDEELDSDDTDVFVIDDAGGQIIRGVSPSLDQQEMDWEPELSSKPHDLSQNPITDPSTAFTANEGAKQNLLFVPALTDSSEYESNFERPVRGHSKKYRRLGKSVAKPVDLTGSSPPASSRRTSSRASSFEVHTPKLEATDTFNMRNTLEGAQESDSPDSVLETGLGHRKRRKESFIFHIKRVLKLTWEKIEPHGENEVPDRRLALAKAVYSLKLHNLKRLDDYLKTFHIDDDMAEVLRNGLDAEYNIEPEISDVHKRNQGNARDLTHLLITYATGRHVHEDFDLSEQQLSDGHDVVIEGFYEFHKLLGELLRHFMDWMKRSAELESVHLEDAETEPELSADPPEPGSASKRRRKVVQSKDVLAQQHNDQLRVQEQEKKRAILLQLQSQAGTSPDQLSVSINISEPIVYLDPKLAAQAKSHQIDGIRFMWREIIENPRGEGCLLAHTMGLGKTMQVITLLASIAQCNRSTDPAVQQHIPKHLQRLRIMILCPMGLVDNWFAELEKWLPDTMMLGVVIKLDNNVKQPAITIEGWFKDGGVLIIGYEKFQRWVAPMKSLDHIEGFTERRRHLIEGPDIVIADEAHRLKNAASLVNRAASQIATKSRVAMTGSPLNNHLEEYHTMIDWISPGYLGSIVQFKARYVEPITAGLYSESTSWDRKASMKRLHMLKRIIAPKVSRADITAISKDLPPKTEFFITIPLTKEQMEAYKIYVEDLRATSNGKASNTRVWSWLNILGLLLNHPSCFVEKMKQKDKVKSLVVQQRSIESEDEGYDSAVAAAMVDNVAVDQEPGLTSAMEKVLNVFAEARVLSGMDDPSLSYKSLLIKRIVEQAVRVKEKTLIFSKSIPTLNYYEGMIKKMKLRYMRIDGQDQSKPGSRQEEVNEFNEGDGYKVFLISTKAGGLGLNIQSASRVIISDFDFNPTWEEQAVGRAYRIGQQKPVFVYRFLVGGTFEELIHNKAVFKTQLFTRVVDERNVMSQAKQKPGEFLFDPQEVPQKTFLGCLGKDPEVLDKVLEKVDCVRDIFLTETYFQDVDEDLTEQELKEANDQLELEVLERDNPEEHKRRLRLQANMQSQLSSQQKQQSATHRTTNVQAIPTPSSSNATSSFRHFINLRVPHDTEPSSKPVVMSTPPSGTAYDDNFPNPSRSTGRFVNSQTIFRDDQFRPDQSALVKGVDAASSLTDSFSGQRSPYFFSRGEPSFHRRSPETSVNQDHYKDSTATRDDAVGEQNQIGAGTHNDEEDNNPEAAQCRPQ